MKKLLLPVLLLLAFSCQKAIDKEAVKKEVYDSEKAFEKMCADSGIAYGFYAFADEQAVIKRQNDTLITGKDDIKKYYDKSSATKATVNWTADFIDVSEDGSMAWTYGNYVWKIEGDSSKVTEYKGVFHTVWKKQTDGGWKYVWD